MKIDTKELERLAAAQPRVDMYTGIHKALRACMVDALLALGRVDLDDDAELAGATQRLLELLDFCAAHVRHENEHVHRAMEARGAGSSAAVAHEHEEHLAHIEELRAAAQELQGLRPALRHVAAGQLYRQLALFVAENFRHMHTEETAHNAVLWARYTDAELEQVHDELIASIPPAEMMAAVRWLVPFMNPAERIGLLSDMRAKAPPQAFDAVLAAARPHLTGNEWAKLARGLGLAPVPGLVAA